MTVPSVFVVIGPAGSGKTTVAQKTARENNAAYLDKDRVCGRFVEFALKATGHDPADRESNDYYRENLLPLEYDTLMDVAGANLRLGRSVVLDAPFGAYFDVPDFLTRAAERFHWPSSETTVVRVRVPQDLLREHAPANRRGLFGSFSNMASGLATLAATGAAAIVTSSFSPADLAAWGWRIPFVAGGILGVVGLILRARAEETPEFEAGVLVDQKSAAARLWDLLREHPKALLQAAALSAPAVAYYTWATFLPTYAKLTSGRDLSSTLAGSVIGLALLVVIVPVCGALSDRLGRRKIFPIIGAIGMIVLFYPLLLLLNQPGFGVYVLVSASGWVVLGIWQSIYPTIQAELFPASVRVSGIGFAHQIVIAVFGGTAPLVAAAFVGAGQPMLVAVYMIVIVALCLVVYFTLPETGTSGDRVTVALADPEVLEGEHLVASTSPHSQQPKRSL